MARRGRWSAKTLAIVEAMWLHGESSEALIAMQITRARFCGPVTRAQVGGIITRMGIRNLNPTDRQRRLDRLKLMREDGGLLPERCFQIMVTK